MSVQGTHAEHMAAQTAMMWRTAIRDSFLRLDPRQQIRNPVMFVVEVTSILTTILFLQALFGKGEAPAPFIGSVSAWLWFTVVFANFAEALAEGRGKAQAEALRRARKDTPAKRLQRPERGAPYEMVSSTAPRKGDGRLVETGGTIPGHG